jgi:hypothetical protein
MLAPLALATLAACAEDSVVEVGIVEFLDRPFMLDMPAAARAGESFEIGVPTYGGGCESEESTDVQNDSEELVTITPYDRRILADACTIPLRIFPHRASVSFALPGMKTLRVRGRKLDDHRKFSDVVHERQIQIDDAN